MKSVRLLSIFTLLLLMAATVVPGLQAQVCPNGNGGGSGSGGGGATLMTITVDGNPGDWGAVLANPLQVTTDGEWVSCSTSTDKDYVIDPVLPTCATKGVSGRDLAVFAWTYDTTITNPTPAVYLYVKRFGSASNTQTFYFYMDTNSNQRMNTGEKVYQVLLGGSNRKTTGTLYNYTAVDGTNGDPLVAPAGSTYPGYADGYTLAGSLNLASETLIYADIIGGFPDGSGFEAYLPWTNIGTPAGTAIYFHVSSTNSSNPAQVPASLDDNLGGIDGKIGAFAFQSLSVTPDHSSAVTPNNPTVVWYPHVVANTGTLPDSYLLTTFSSLGLRVDLYASDQSTLLATDLNGNGSYADPGDQAPSPISLVAGASGYYQLWVKITAPSGLSNVQDATTLSAFSQTVTDLCASAKDTTTIGNLTLTPTPQAKSVVAGQTVDYGLKLDNFIVGHTINLQAQSSLGWTIQLFPDSDGDGIPDGPALGATVTPGARPYYFVVRLTGAGSVTAPPTVDTCSVVAQDITTGDNATAVLTTTLRNRLTFTPSYTVSSGTNKYSGQGQSVFYAHTLINSWPTSDTIALSSTSSPAWAVRYYTDPDGDGNPADGALITGSFDLAGNGGTLRLVVEVVIPSGLTLPVTHTSVVTATGGSGSADAQSVTDEVRVSYVATYSDANRTISFRVFALCQTIYTKGSSLVANSSYTFRYLDPASAVRLSQAVVSDGNGEALSQYSLLSSDTRGDWLIELRNASNVLVDSIAVFVDPPIEGNLSTVSPVVTGQASYDQNDDNLSITATFNNTSTGADYTGTSYHYLVRSPGGSLYLTPAGTFEPYTGSEMTRTTSPHTVYHSSSDTETVTVNNVHFPSAGVYTIDVIWEGSCSNTIASTATTAPPTTLDFPVGTNLNSFNAGGGVGPQDDFIAGSMVYLHGTDYLPDTSYQVAYYNENNQLVSGQTQSVTSSSGGVLDTSLPAGTLTCGLWHAVVYPATVAPPGVYNDSDPQALSDDWFAGIPATPSVTPAGPFSFCADDTISELLTSSATTGTYQWYEGGNPITGATNQTYTATAAGSYTVKVTVSGYTSAASNAVVVTVHPLPPVTITPSGPTIFCAGGSVTLTASGASSYLWSPGGETTVSIIANATGTYTVTGTDGNGCQNTASQGVTVNPLPVVSDVTMQAALAGTGPWTYPVGGTFPSFKMCIDAGVPFYYLDVNTLTSSTALLADTLNPFTLDTDSLPPTWTAYWVAKGVVSGATGWQGVMYQIITGAQPMFYIDYTGGDYQLIDGLTYQMGGGLTPLRVSGDYPQWNYQYTGTVTDVNSCVSSFFDVFFEFNTTPVVSDVTLQASLTGTGPWTYPVGGDFATGFDMCIDAGVPFYYLDVNTLTSSTALLADTLNPFTLDQASLPPTWLAYWDAKGVNAGALPGTWQAAMYQIITGAQPMFYIDYTAGDYRLIDGLTYQMGGGLTPLRVSGDYPQWNYQYTGAVTGDNSCVSSFFDVFFEFNPIPAATITADGPLTFCAGGSVTLDAGVHGSYLWSTLETTRTITVTTSGSFTVVVTDLGCASLPSAATVVTVNPIPTAPTVDSPIVAGDTTISGTSTLPSDTEIEVYSNGTSIGTTTVQPDGTWMVTGAFGFVGGESITAKAGPSACQSAASNTVVVTPAAPVISGPLVAGQTSVTGTSTAPVGSTITVTIGGTPYTTTIQSGGTWSVTVPALVGNTTVSATVTAGGQTSGTTTSTVHFLPPVVTGPILAGASSISGTSTAADGTIVTVYQDGASIGTATVTGGNWTLTGVTGLVGGESITAKAAVGTAAESAVSNIVVVTTIPSFPPIVSSSIVSTAPTPQTVYGSSVEAPGSVITVYLNGVALGTQPVVQADGSWSLPGVTLVAGDIVSATVLAAGKSVSTLSNQVRVSANSGSVTPPPVITGTYLDGATSVSGTSVPGATVDIYADGFYVGTVTADGSGNWILGPGPGIGPLPSGTILSATATAPCPTACTGTSDWSAPVIVGDMIMLLRSDIMTTLTQARAPIFTHPVASPPYPSLETIGPNHVFNQTEGPSPQPASPGTLDDDKAYVRNIQSLDLEPEPAVLTDNGRPLVFYELLDNNTKTLKLNKFTDGFGVVHIQFTITP